MCALPAHTHTHTHSSAHTHRGLPHAGGVLCLREMGQQVPAPYQMRTLSPRGASDRSTADFRAGTPDSALGLRLPFPMCPIQMSGRCWNPVVMHVCRTSGLSLLASARASWRGWCSVATGALLPAHDVAQHNLSGLNLATSNRATWRAPPHLFPPCKATRRLMGLRGMLLTSWCPCGGDTRESRDWAQPRRTMPEAFQRDIGGRCQ